jgi:hypothetical protein
MAIISSKGVASLKRLFLAMSDAERKQFVTKYSDILNQAPLDFSRNILKEQELQEEINKTMRQKYFENKINKEDYYIFNGDYAENLIYFLKKIIQTDPAILENEANSPFLSDIKDRLLLTVRQKWFIFTMLAISVTYSLGLLIPALLPLVTILIGVAAGLALVAAVWFSKGSSDNTTLSPPRYENVVPQETVTYFENYLKPDQTASPKLGKNAAPKASDATEPLVSVSSQSNIRQPQSAPSVEVRGGQSGDPQVSISSRNRR